MTLPVSVSSSKAGMIVRSLASFPVGALEGEWQTAVVVELLIKRQPSLARCSSV